MLDFPAHARGARRGFSRAVIAAALGAGLLFTNPAAAQLLPYGQEEDPLPPPTISRMLARQGFQPLSRPRFQGDVYVVHALSPAGARVRLMIDAYNGSIVRSVRLDDDPRPPPGVREFLDRETDLDPLDDEPPPRARRPQLQLDDEPLQAQRPQAQPEERKAVRPETPGRAPAGAPAQRRSAPPSNAVVTPADPAPAVDKPKQDLAPPDSRATRAAAPSPSVKPESPVGTPPPPTVGAAKPAAGKPEPAKTAEQKPAASSGPPPSVRVIEGVTPIIPQDRPAESVDAKQ